MNRDETLTILGLITGVYPNIFDPKISLPSWELVLGDIPFEEVLSALKVYLSQSHQYPPRPGDINELIKQAKLEKFPPYALVWDQILSCAKSSMDEKEVFKLLEGNEPAISALTQVEYNVIRYCDVEKVLPYKKRDFEKAYLEQIEDKKEVEPKRIGTNEAKQILDRITQKLIC